MATSTRSTRLSPLSNGLAFLAWVRRLGLEHELERPVAEVAPHCRTPFERSRLERAPATVTIRTVVVEEQLQRAYLRHPSWQLVAAAATAFVEGLSDERLGTALAARIERAMPSEPALAVTIARYQRWLSSLGGPVSTVAGGTKLTLRLQVDPSAFILTLDPDGKRGWSSLTVQTAIDLDTAAKGGRVWTCSCSDFTWYRRSCSHLRLAIHHLLEELIDPQRELHPHLVRLFTAPPWARALDRLVWAIPEERPARAERLLWHVGRNQVGGVGVELRISKQTKTGGWTKGKAATKKDIQHWRREAAAPDFAPLAALAAMHADGDLATHVGHVLEALCGHPGVVSATTPGAAVRVERTVPRIALRATANGATELGVDLAGSFASGAAFAAMRVGSTHLAHLDEAAGRCLVATVPPSLERVFAILAATPVAVPPDGLGEALGVVRRLARHTPLVIDPVLAGDTVSVPPQPGVRIELSDGGGVAVALRVVTRAGAAQVPGHEPAHVVEMDDGRVVHAVRDLAAEEAAAIALAAHLELSANLATGPWTYAVDDPDAALDLLARLAEAAAGDLVVEWAEGQLPPRIRHAGPRDLRVSLTRAPGSWFEIGGGLEVDGQTTSLAALLEAVRGGRRYVRLGPGRFARLADDLRSRLRSLDRSASSLGADGLALGSVAAARVGELLGDEVAVAGDQEYAALLARLAAARTLEVEVPTALEADLRPYQAEGFRWLARLAAWQAGGILADDMGLGKTVQTLALLLHRAERGPALVVAPTSVCAGWRSEAARFAPTLRVLLSRGPGRRELLAGVGPGDVVVTSYDLLVNDVEELAAISFATFVVDEAQAVKNARTQRAAAARRIQAEVAFALSGTPLENHTGELWAIFRTVCPGLLGSWERFRTSFAGPIERQRDATALADLARLVRPFLLRRTKAQVAPELPPRTEVVRAVKLGALERRLYEGERQRAIAGLVGAGALGHDDRFDILAAILRLRLLACHPRLVDADAPAASAKLEEAMELITDLRGDGQRALVFSQFTRHLALLRERLEAAGLPYLYLDGSTPAATRDRLVAEWQGGGPGLFLLSLKAGGTGLNLMGADCVLHLDPWWNPAVEDQATDRTHRIGQTRPVTVVRLIAEATIEETVLELHDSKRELARGILDGTQAAAALSAAELLDLIRRSGAADGEGAADDGEENGGPPTVEAEQPTAPAADPVADPAAAVTAGIRPGEELAAAALAVLVEGFELRLRAPLTGDRKASPSTVKAYSRAARRWLAYADSPLGAVCSRRPLTTWVSDYLEALSGGLVPMATSELLVARAALNRLVAMAAGDG